MFNLFAFPFNVLLGKRDFCSLSNPTVLKTKQFIKMWTDNINNTKSLRRMCINLFSALSTGTFRSNNISKILAEAAATKTWFASSDAKDAASDVLWILVQEPHKNSPIFHLFLHKISDDCGPHHTYDFGYWLRWNSLFHHINLQLPMNWIWFLQWSFNLR